MSIDMIFWKPIEELVITPAMENASFLLYIEQTKMCRRQLPEVVVGIVIDGELDIEDGYDVSYLQDATLCKVTHYAVYNTPWESI